MSAIQCDPGTTMNENGICVGTGVGGPATCSPPATGKACIQGTIYDFHSNAKATTPIHLELYDPIKLLQGGGPLASTDSTDGFSYKFQDFMPPTLGLVVIVTAGLVPGMTTAGFVPTGSAGQGIGAAKYTIDTYALTTTDAAKWNFDITTGGAFIAKFYSNPAPAAGAPVVVADDKTAVAGVTLLKDGANAGAKYFDATLTAVDPTLTVTGTSGTAIVASPVAMGSNFSQFTGMGPAGMTWETHPGGSAPNLVLILRFHPM
ncbi:MAG: hypothetical protein JWM53_3966 [bacterium]|nr:hypothetical protein [bacterium]